MSFKALYAVPLALLLLVSSAADAQTEKLSNDDLHSYQIQLPDAANSAPGALRPYMQGLSPKTGAGQKAIANAVRVANDLKKLNTVPDSLVHYAVPAMSDMMRLGDAYPIDGDAGGTVRIIAAGDEYEPGSFVIFPFRSLSQAKLELTQFKTKDGKVFPAEQLDLKVIKVWYQNGNGWFSYFGDLGLKLTPELLLNDEELIKVDTSKVANYARLKTAAGVKYKWTTPPRILDSSYDEHWIPFDTFQQMTPEFCDAATLQPVTLNQGEFKQFFLTAHVLKDMAPGLYQGSIKIKDMSGKEIGSVPVSIKALSFNLPTPRTYFDIDREFFISSYSYIRLELIMFENGGDRELAKKQYVKIMKNMLAHGQTTHPGGARIGKDQLELIQLHKEAGMRNNPLHGAGISGNNKFERENYAVLAKKWYDEQLGHHNAIIGYGDEPDADWVVNFRPLARIFQKHGFKFYIAGHDVVFHKGGYLFDLQPTAKFPEDDLIPNLYNQIGHTMVAWYAAQHVGPENPAFNRLQYGILPYLSGYSALCNYAHHLGPLNDRSKTYKPMVFAYGHYNGYLDTLAWEGFREGVDDIRYASLLKTLARQASKSDAIDVAYAGRQALQFFAEFDRQKIDMNATRLEMANYILKLQDLLKTK